jgi:hypothetical protein
VPGPPELKWLTYVACADLVDPRADLPAEALLRLGVLLADRCSDSARRNAGSLVRTNAEMLRSGATAASHITSPSDGLLARVFVSDLRSALEFPLHDYRALELSPLAAAKELIDTLAYTQGDDAASRRAIAGRLLFAKRTYPELVSLLEELPTPPERIAQLERLSVYACPGRHTQALALRMAELSAFVAARDASVTQARNAGKRGEQIVDLLVIDAKERAGAPRSTGGGDTAVSSGGEVPAEPAAAPLSTQALSDAFEDDKFVQAAALIATKNPDTADGRRSILEIGTGSGSPIFQQALRRPAYFARQHRALAAFIASATELPSYIGQRQAMAANGRVPDLAKEWELHSSQIALLNKGKVSQMTLVNPPHGFIPLLNLTASEPFEGVPEDQLYTNEAVLGRLGPFGHKMLVAWGGAGLATSTTGYTFDTLCSTQKEYVEWIHEQGDKVQEDLLPHADAIFRAALVRIDAELQRWLDAPEPRHTKLPHLLSFGETYDQAIAAKKAGISPLITLHRALPGLIPKSSPRSLPGVVLPGQSGGSSSEEKGNGRDQDKDKDKSKKVKAGSKKAAATWSSDGKHLTLGSDTFAIAKYIEKLGLDEGDKWCWPVLVSKQPRELSIAFCPCPNKAGHNGPNGRWHKSPKGFSTKDLYQNFCETAEGGSPAKKQKKK